MGLKSVTMVGALPPLKGNAYYCLSLSKEMSRRISTEFISFKSLYPEFLYPGGVKDEDPGFYISQTPTLTIRRIITYYNPFSWIWAGWIARSDVVHLQWWSMPLAPIYVVLLTVLKARRKKIIFTVHNVVPHERSTLDNLFSQAVLSFGDAFIVHSKNNKAGLVKYLKLPENRIHVIHMPVHDMYGSEKLDRTTIRNKLGLPQDAKIILSFGNIRKYKGIDSLIEAMARLLEDVPDAHLLIAGQNWGSWEEPYGKLIRKTGIGDHITTILRYIPMSEVKELFQAADLVVLPYVEFDAQSGVGNIALAFEMPLVVTRVGALPELVRDERAVCEPRNFTQLADTMKTILLDPQLYSKLSQDASILREKFSWSSAVDRTMAIYHQSTLEQRN